MATLLNAFNLLIMILPAICSIHRLQISITSSASPHCSTQQKSNDHTPSESHRAAEMEAICYLYTTKIPSVTPGVETPGASDSLVMRSLSSSVITNVLDKVVRP